MRLIALCCALSGVGCFPHKPPVALVPKPFIIAPGLPTHEIARVLALRGYSVTMVDDKSGIVSTDWHEYTARFGDNFVPMPVRERVQVVRDATGQRVSFTVQCDWRKSAAGGNTASLFLTGQTGPDPYYAATAGWETCKEPDGRPLTEIRERYDALIAEIQTARRATR